MDGIEIVIVSTVSLYSQSYGFPVVMYGCESWTIKKAEHRRIDAFGVGKDFGESLGLQGDPTSPS